MNLYDYCGSGKILVVDDDPGVRELLLNRLNLLGYQVAIARDGAHALERIANFRPDAVILDLAMPRLDGATLLEQIGKDALMKLPVLILTASASREEIQRAIQLGARDYLTKPFSEMQLYRRVARLFQTSRAQGRPAPLRHALPT